MSPVLTRPRPRPLPRSEESNVALVVGSVVVGVALLILVVAPAVRLPEVVPQITIANPHPWNVNVEVSNASRSGWLGVGGIDRETTHTFRQIIDQGEEWIFRFDYGSTDGGELVITRSDLEHGGWRITVPEEFASHMRASDTPPSAT